MYFSNTGFSDVVLQYGLHESHAAFVYRGDDNSGSIDISSTNIVGHILNAYVKDCDSVF